MSFNFKLNRISELTEIGEHFAVLEVAEMNNDTVEFIHFSYLIEGWKK